MTTITVPAFLFGALAGVPFAWLFFALNRPKWSAEQQLEHLRLNVSQDARWMAHSPLAKAICARYESMLADNWYENSVTDIYSFREQVGICPHSKPFATGGYVPAGEPYVMGETRSPAFPVLTGLPSYTDGGLVGGNKEGGAA